MNLRALTRGDAAVAGAAVLLFIASFLPYWTVSCAGRYCGPDASQNAWSTQLFPILPSIYLLGIAAAVLILVQRFQGQAATNRQVLGLRLDQWGIAFAVAALWTSIWALGGGYDGAGISHGFGAWLGLISLIVLAGAAAAGPLVPALKAPLVSDRPAVPYQGGYPGAGQPGAPGQPGQYGYPAQGHDPAFGAQGGYGYPAAGQPQPGQPAQAGQPQDAGVPAPQPAAPVAQQPAPAADFQPFWFAVPAPRQLAPKDNPAGAPIGEVVPGTWYLAVEQRGTALVAQLPDGTQGVLADTQGIQRG
ncbi:hypothetical protein BX285_2635 [Streptomyces sp. 1114.5]|uniref:hypothetical protein n=1 Tax=unclassified Streptomyces TaxID=2593676 RepID=UPI000BD9B181|nr:MULTISPECIES: hypothetical protein [unclassified Streptomyces]RKT18217.1 hypothetical protein BX285_2635 [Streptomyces sp. 1114.5]SOB84415.1 hypothetical protein SAMN06272789_4667 [Streptomyces sp. 1331.2]